MYGPDFKAERSRSTTSRSPASAKESTRRPRRLASGHRIPSSPVVGRLGSGKAHPLGDRRGIHRWVDIDSLLLHPVGGATSRSSSEDPRMSRTPSFSELAAAVVDAGDHHACRACMGSRRHLSRGCEICAGNACLGSSVGHWRLIGNSGARRCSGLPIPLNWQRRTS
jgi:hypothetical protein